MRRPTLSQTCFQYENENIIFENSIQEDSIELQQDQNITGAVQGSKSFII